MGFGIMASVVTNNVAALAALGNGMLPLRKIAQIERAKAQERTEAIACPGKKSCLSDDFVDRSTRRLVGRSSRNIIGGVTRSRSDRIKVA